MCVCERARSLVDVGLVGVDGDDFLAVEDCEKPPRHHEAAADRGVEGGEDGLDLRGIYIYIRVSS